MRSSAAALALVLGLLAATCVPASSDADLVLSGIIGEEDEGDPGGEHWIMTLGTPGVGNREMYHLDRIEDRAFHHDDCEGILRRHRAAKHEMADLLAGMYLRTDSDSLVLHQILLRDFVVDKYGMLEADVRPGDVVVDVGAHVGLFSLLAAQLWPRARVYAFEPAPGPYRLLRHNVRANNLTARIRAFNVAVTGDGRPVRLASETGLRPYANIYGRDFWHDLPGREYDSEEDERRRRVRDSSHYEEFGLEPPGESVPSLTVAGLWEQIRADLRLSDGDGPLSVGLLKMDCEGCEHEAFPDAAALTGPKARVWSLRGEARRVRSGGRGPRGVCRCTAWRGRGASGAGRASRRWGRASSGLPTGWSGRRAYPPSLRPPAPSGCRDTFRCEGHRPREKPRPPRRQPLARAAAPAPAPAEPAFQYAGAVGHPQTEPAAVRPRWRPQPKPRGWRHGEGRGAGE